jgi:hypothetical protein
MRLIFLLSFLSKQQLGVSLPHCYADLDCYQGFSANGHPCACFGSTYTKIGANGHPDPRHWLKVKANLLQKWSILYTCTLYTSLCGNFVNLLYEILLADEISTEF